jgi:hypothetical protein
VGLAVDASVTRHHLDHEQSADGAEGGVLPKAGGGWEHKRTTTNSCGCDSHALA